MDIDTHQYQLVKTFFVEHKFCGKFAFLDRWVGIGYLSAFFEGKFLRYLQITKLKAFRISSVYSMH
jgi:hypothetical protein